MRDVNNLPGIFTEKIEILNILKIKENLVFLGTWEEKAEAAICEISTVNNCLLHEYLYMYRFKFKAVGSFSQCEIWWEHHRQCVTFKPAGMTNTGWCVCSTKIYLNLLQTKLLVRKLIKWPVFRRDEH